MPNDTKSRNEQFRAELRSLSIWVGLLGLIASVLYVRPFGWSEGLSILGAALVVAGAAGAIGGFTGFLFGIPKTLQSDQPTADGGTLYIANTNLEQISDWLTKILVGVGLIQIARTPEALGDLGDTLRPLFGDKDSSAAFALALCLFFFVAGFAVGHMWTRAFFRGILRDADKDIVEQISNVLSDRDDANARALSLVDRQLSGTQPPSQAELDAAVAKASPDWLDTIYRRAEEQRRLKWKDEPQAMARTIPVFKALAAADTDKHFFAHFGSLGWALKDSEPPQHEEAIRNLTTAIEIRDKRGFGGVQLYEWNRAVCRIRLDPNFAADKPSDDIVKAEILADLQVAAGALADRMFKANGDRDATAVANWMSLNGTSLADLKKNS